MWRCPRLVIFCKVSYSFTGFEKSIALDLAYLAYNLTFLPCPMLGDSQGQPNEEKTLQFIQDRERTAQYPVYRFLWAASIAHNLSSRFPTVSWERPYSYCIIKKLQKLSIQTVTTATCNVFLKIPFISYSRVACLCYSCCFCGLWLTFFCIWNILQYGSGFLPWQTGNNIGCLISLILDCQESLPKQHFLGW